MVCSRRSEVIADMRRLATILLAAVAVLSLAACASAGATGSTSGDPTAVFCPALDAYGKSLAAVEALTPTSSVDDYKKAATQAKADLVALKAVAGPFVGAQLDTLQTAQAQLDAAVAGLPANPTPADAEAAVEPAVKTVIGQVVSTYNAICNAHPTPSSAS